jgi:hypothetical protein
MSAVDSKVSELVERMMTRTRLEQAASSPPTARCPEHPDTVLDGGPIRYRCERGQDVAAADLDREVPVPSSGAEEPFMQAIAADFSAMADTIRGGTDMDAVRSRLCAAMRERGEAR